MSADGKDAGKAPGEAITPEIIPARRKGRREKYGPEIVKALAEAITLGLSQKRACEAAGISYDTFRRWTHSKPGFRDAMRKAETDFIGRNLAMIAAASLRTWQAAAWLLERRFPKEWGKVETIKASIRDGEESETKRPEMADRLAQIFGLRKEYFRDVDELEKGGKIQKALQQAQGAEKPPAAKPGKPWPAREDCEDVPPDADGMK